MKKILMTISVVLLLALICAALIACNTQNDANGGDGQNQYETAKYTVTFNTNGDFVLANSVLKNIPSGSKIQPPKDKDGNEIIPVKKGYTFQYWSSDGTKAFDFDNDVITKNTTLTAIYTNNVYKHTTVLTAKLIYNADGSYEIDENGYPQEAVSLPAAELDKNTTSIKSTYNGSLSNLACPTISVDGDKFCFWYYIDNDGNPVQFTKWANTTDTSVAMLSKYYFTRELTLYPMYYSNLPKVQLIYRDSATEAVYDQSNFYPICDDVPIADAIATPVRAGYVFDGWYYIVKNDDDDEIEYSFEYAQEESDATDIISAAMLDDNFTNGTLRLYARWKRLISIASLADYMNVYDALRVQNPTEEQQKEIDEILSAEIRISDIDFGGAELQPLFDADRVFQGTLDGGVYTESGNLSSNATLSNATFAYDTHVSVFGYIGGCVKNINIENISLNLTEKDGNYSNSAYIGVIATQNSGEIYNCNVRLTDVSLQGMNTVLFGGIAAKNTGSNGISTKGYIHDCSVSISSFTAQCEGLVFGGVTAESNASSRISKNNVDITVSSVDCSDDGVAANGKSSVKIGGIVGVNGGTVSGSTVKIKIDSLASSDETYFGGAVAVNTGNIGTTKAFATLCSEQMPARIGASLSQVAAIGGLIGKNEGALVNSHCEVQLYACATNSNSIIAIGGLIGNNFSDKRDSSTSQTQGIGVIYSSYAVGDISLTSDESLSNVTVYAGGLAGRNSQSKITQNFAIVNVSVVNEGTNNVGFLFGSMENKSTIVSGWYADDNILALNGIVYSEGNFEALTNGVSVAKENFSDSVWVLGSSQVSSTLGFDDEVWSVAGDGSLPVLK